MRHYEFNGKPANTTDIEAVLNDQYSSNAMKLICLIAEHQGVDISPIADEKTSKDGKKFTVYRLSSKDGNAILGSF
jgi:hypothetical protein